MRRALPLLLCCAGCFGIDALSRNYDAGVPDDAATGDLAADDDLAATSDLSSPPDLSSSADLATGDAAAPGWRTLSAPASGPLRAITGAPAIGTFAAGGGSLMLRLDGNLAGESLPPGFTLRALAIAGDPFSVGDEGAALVRADGGWSQSTSLGDDTLYAAWAAGAAELFAVGSGGIIAHFVNATWTNEAVEGFGLGLYGVWGRSSTDVVAVGEAGNVLHRTSSWTVLSPVAAVDLRAVGGTATGYYAVGVEGKIFRSSDGDAWTAEASGVTETLHGVFALGSNAWAVGENGAILRRSGGSWQKERSGGATLRAVWAASASDVWAVGDSGTLLHFAP